MPDKILLIGHSLVGQTMPQMLNSVMESLNRDVQAEVQVINGAPLRYNWDNGDIAQGVNARNALVDGSYDVVVVTEAIPLEDQLIWNDTHGYATRYYDLATTANPATRFYVYETWHGLGQDVAGWRDQLDQDLTKWEGIADHINAQAPQGMPEALIVPAGQAMARLYDAIEAGQVPGLTTIHDVFADDIHLNDMGQWFIAGLQAATLAQVAPDELPTQTIDPYGIPFDAPDAAMAAALTGIIGATLSNYDRDGVAEPGTGAGDNGDGPGQDDGNGDTGHDPDDNPQTGGTDNGEDTPAADPKEPVDITLGLGFGLTGIADYAPNSPFLDVFKTSRDFFGHEPGRYGGVDHAELVAAGVFDAQGWPTFIPEGIEKIGTLILTELPTEMTDAAGRYRITWDGEGDLRPGLSARNIVLGEGEAWFDYTPDGTGLVSIDIFETDPMGTGNHLRNISVVKHEHIDAFEASALFNPDWIEVIKDAHALRFMDWMQTNNSDVTTWQDVPSPNDASWSGGVPLETMIALANQTGTDPWFNIPHLADESYIRAFATQVRETLDPSLKAYFEFSNEVWNFQFAQANHAHIDGAQRFPGETAAWVQNYAADAVSMARIIDDIFAADAGRAVKVIATQTGWLGLEEPILQAPAWVAEDPTANAAPHTYFDAYAVTGYFDGGLGRDQKPLTVKAWLAESLERATASADTQGLVGTARQKFIEAHRFDHATTLAIDELRDGSVTGNSAGSLLDLQAQFAYHRQVAETHGLALVMYEGGTHVVGVGQWQNDEELTEFFTHLNYTPEMGGLYAELLQMWSDEGGTLFNAFTAVGRPSQFGSWGHLRFLGDETSRMDAIDAFLVANPKPDFPAQNTDPEVSVSIEGALVGGETLTANIEEFHDLDEFDTLVLQFQWQRDGRDIVGATAQSHLLVPDDVGAQMSLDVRYIDVSGAVTLVQSELTDLIQHINRDPEGFVSISGNLIEGGVILAELGNLTDPDILDASSLRFQWMSNGSPIADATAASYVLGQVDVGTTIALHVSYTDGFGTLEQVMSGPSAPIENVNNAPVGSVSIDGTVMQGGSLRAVTQGVVDLDGIDYHTVSYQWLRDGVQVFGATAESYELRQADVGAAMSVMYLFRDDFGTIEMVTSSLTPLVGNVNDPLSGSLMVEGTGQVGGILRADSQFLFDPDGVHPSKTEWQWLRQDAQGIASTIAGANSETYQITEDDQGYMILPQFRYLDTFGGEGLAVGPGRHMNTPHTGIAKIIGNPVVGEVVSADISGVWDAEGGVSDQDGYQWFRNGNQIAGAKGATYVLAPEDEGQEIRFQLSYVDGMNHHETIFSAAEHVIAAGLDLLGTNLQDILVGDTGNDRIMAGGGNDFLKPGAGNDTVFGGTGDDMVAISGMLSDFTVVLGADNSVLIDHRDVAQGGQGRDLLTSVEFLDFAPGGEILFEGPMPLHLFAGASQISEEVLYSIAELYIAYFNRAPDAPGLYYWASEYMRGFSIHDMAKSLFAQPETQVTYAQMLSASGDFLTDVEGFVTAVYANVLGRDPDPDGFTYWVGQLQDNSEIMPSNFILALLGGARSTANPTPQTLLDQAYLEAKTDIGIYFSAIRGLTDVADATAVMTGFDGSHDGVLHAVDAVDALYAEAMEPETSAFLFQLAGVIDDPFAIA